jgi:putative SOS response-associated peptidase YedK
MCGRFALAAPRAELISRFDLTEYAHLSPRYNIPPGSDIPVVQRAPEGHRVLRMMRWGLVPSWAKDPGIGARLNNARGETVAEKPSFRSAFKYRRCLVPASGFFEWAKDGQIKQPYYISLKSGGPMAMAGLWESWKPPEGPMLHTVCIITTRANELMEPIHDRMPVIISPDRWQVWLSPRAKKDGPDSPSAWIGEMVAPYPASEMQAWPVSRRVSKSGEEGADLIFRI